MCSSLSPHSTSGLDTMNRAPDPSSSHLKGLRQQRKKKMDAMTKIDVAVATDFLATWCSRALNESHQGTSESGGCRRLASTALINVRMTE